jgi:glucose dehydrogenase
MADKQIAIIGAGIVGSILAYHLTERGHQVTVFEKGPEYPYPHNRQWQEQTLYLHNSSAYELPTDVKRYTSDGIPFDLEGERYMRVGGSATAWEGICIRMGPSDFQTRSRFGYGDDWPLTYDDLESFYGQAEALIGVSGTDDDNPFAPPRSSPYPMPEFPLAADDALMQSHLAESGIVLHTTPQARTRHAYEDRAGCVNFGTCRHCPIGARYSPNYHLQKAIDSGRCSVITGTTVRRLVPDVDGGGCTVVYRDNDHADDQEFHADIVIVAAGAVESARLLLLSNDERSPDGLGNRGGWVGRGLAFHHVWKGRMRYEEALHPFRFGGWTGQSLQFVDAPTRGEHAAVKVEFSSRKAYDPALNWSTARSPEEALAPMLHWRQIILQAEAPGSEEKYVTLSPEVDRFGDPFAHVHYRFTDFDIATYDFARQVFDQFVSATRAVQSEFPPLDWWDSGSHHMGTCRMGSSVSDSVVNSFGQLHEHERVFVIGGSNFVGTSGAMNPTLTMVALALRSLNAILAIL